MSAPRCSRRWQAEAIADGRLSRAERASFERHCESCAECLRDASVLTRISDAAAGLPTLSSTPLERRRLRARVLERADAVQLTGSSWGVFSRKVSVALAAATLAAAALIGLSAVALRGSAPRSLGSPSSSPFVSAPATPTMAPPAPAASAPTFTMTPSANSEWHVEERTATVIHRLVRGHFDFHVEKLDPEQRFVVGLPDGEIEVKGTRFIVEVESGATHRISCTEGRIVLRVADRPELVISAGESWRPAPSVPAVGSSSPPSASRASAATVSRVVRAPSEAAAPGAEFLAAMSAFDDGDLGRAERLFLAFEQRHPGDARAEDAAFLCAVARSRRGDAEGARALARAYLERYPNGLRRTEALALAH